MPKPAGFRFYHTHVRGGANLAAGQYSGLVGPVYIEPTQHAGNYDREVFLTLKEFQPTLSRGGDMPMNFLAPAQTVSTLQDAGESKMKASLAKGMPHGYEVGYDSFTINGSMLDHGEPVRVKAGERVLFHVLNGSATEIRSLALPGHSLDVIAMDGNPLPKPIRMPGLWLGTAEPISAIVEMNHPGVWVMGDLADDDRHHGMGISDDVDPIHLHRHSFELTRIAGQVRSGGMKDVVMVGGYQEAEIDFVADNPGLTLFHCHQQLHMDFGFMTLSAYE